MAYRACEDNKILINTSAQAGIAVYDMNLRMTQALSYIFKGYTCIEKFCIAMNIAHFSWIKHGKCGRKLDT